MTLENGMVLAAAACNYGYGWEDENTRDDERYGDDMCDAAREEAIEWDKWDK